MFSGLDRKVGRVFTLSKTIISDFWTQSALTHTAVASTGQYSHVTTLVGSSPRNGFSCSLIGWRPFVRLLLAARVDISRRLSRGVIQLLIKQQHDQTWQWI